MSKLAIAIVSGGMDSVTMAHRLKSDGYRLHMVSFDYGQRHRKELQSAEYFAKRLEADFSLIEMAGMQYHLGGSALTDLSIMVPDGHYAEPSMKITVVPNRNAIMLSIAWGIAVAKQASCVATAVHGGDHHIYPDCRPPFIASLNEAFRHGTAGHRLEELHICTPYLHLDKTAIARDGKTLGVEYDKTWTCYKGGAIHCGQCGACIERQEALMLAGVEDKTKYLNPMQSV